MCVIRDDDGDGVLMVVTWRRDVMLLNMISRVASFLTWRALSASSHDEGDPEARPNRQTGLDVEPHATLF